MSLKSLVTPVLGGVILAGLAAVAPPSGALGDLLPVGGPTTTQGQGTASYLHDVSQPIPGVSFASSIVEHYAVTAPDGIKLDTWIVRPDIPGPVPVVLKFTPYYGGGDPTIGTVDGWADPLAFPVEYVHLLQRGYAVGISSVRGTGNSGGCFTIGSAAEAKDDAAVIEFLAQQSWSNGNVGLMGVSYDGTAPQDVWVEAPPHLKTIVPISGISDMYRYNFVNGVPIDETIGFPAYYWAITGLGPAGLELGTQAADPVSVPGAMAGEVCEERIEITAEAATSLLDGNKDAYWQERDFLAELQAAPKKKRGSVFYVHGLDDWNVKPHNMEGWLEAVQKSGVPFKAWLSQIDHTVPKRGDWLLVLTAWFDQALKGRDTGILDAPRVQVQDDAGVWRHESKYPPATSAVTLYPQVTGSLGTSPGGLGFAAYDDYAGADVDPSTELPGDRILFTSAPLSTDLHLAGMPRFEGLVTATGDRANLMLTLGDQAPDGTITWFNYAALSLNHAANLAAGKASVADLAQQVGVNFFPQDNVVEAGHRLVLVGAGNFVQGPPMRPIATGSRITWDLAKSKLILPQDKSLVLEPIG